MSEELTIEELRNLVNHKEEIIHQLNIKNDAMHSEIVELKSALYDRHIELHKTRGHYIQTCVQRDALRKKLEETQSQLKQYKGWLEEEGYIFPDTPTIGDDFNEENKDVHSS